MSDHQLKKAIPYYEQFYHSIKDMIFKGTFQPGEWINETQLARTFNVSKSPVREAIRVLVREGLLIVDLKSKVRVYQPTKQDAKEIYQCRQALEPFAVKLAVELITEDELQDLEQLLEKTADAIEVKKGQDEIIQLNEQFHHQLMQYSQNSRLQKQIEELHSLIYLFRVYNFTGHERAKRILDQHKLIFQMLKKQDAQRASQSMEEHLQHDLDHLLSVLS